MKVLDYSEAHKIVQANRNLNWDGWDIVSWVRNPNGATNIHGEFRNGRWGVSRRFTMNDDGTWVVPNKYA